MGVFMLSFSEAFIKMLSGNRIRSCLWLDGDYIYLKDGVIFCDGGFAFGDMLRPEEIRNNWTIAKD
jgi:hypothetical protein